MVTDQQVRRLVMGAQSGPTPGCYIPCEMGA